MKGTRQHHRTRILALMAIVALRVPIPAQVAAAAQAPSPTPAQTPDTNYPVTITPLAQSGQPSQPGRPGGPAGHGIPQGKMGLPPGVGIPGRPGPPPPPAWTQFKLNPKTKIYLDFTDANANSVISFLSRISGITILKDPAFTSKLTVITAKPVSLAAAFETLNTVLNFSGYELHKKGDLMVVERIPPPPQPQPMPQPPQPNNNPVVHSYRLKNANAQQVAKTISDVFAAQASQSPPGMPQGMPMGMSFGMPMMQMGGQPGGGAGGFKTSFDEYSNSVIVYAAAPIQTQVEELIKEIDQPADSAFESQVFVLHHVPADEAIDAVKQMLISLSPTGRGGRQDQQNNNNVFYYNPFGGGGSDPAKGSQTAVEIKPTNSIIVTATKPNLLAIGKLIANLDQESPYVGSEFVITLKNAKADTVATMLNQVFTQRQNSDNQSPFFFVYSDMQQPKKTSGVVQDTDEHGNIVNVRDLTGKVNVISEPSTNSLIIVTQPSNLKFIKNIIEQIDKTPQQVVIETIIVEASLDKTTKLGVEWSFLQNKLLGNPSVTSSGAMNYGLQSGGTLPGFSYTLNGASYKAFINALETDTRFKVLDTPRIFTSNNVKAEINVSQKVPYLQNQSTSTVTGTFSSYNYLDVGVVLDVTPRVTSSGMVSMDVTQTANDLAGFSTFNAPITNNRSAYTTVSVRDGDTVILGGMIRQNKTSTINKIPFLGDLPLIGDLFKSSSIDTGQTELMVFLTPHIVHDASDALHIRDLELKELTKPTKDALKPLIPPSKPSTPGPR